MKRILIADDSGFMRNNLKQVLTLGGYKVVGEAVNGLNAVELYDKLRPDLTILDITMPKLDGLGALRLIKQLNKDAKIIMHSSMGQSAYKEEAFSLGADDFIIKPIKPQDLILTIKNLI